MCLIESFVCGFGILIYSIIHEYVVTHSVVVFLYIKNTNHIINNRNSNLEFYIDVL